MSRAPSCLQTIRSRAITTSILRVVLFKSCEINLSVLVISWKSTVQSSLRLMLDPDTNETRMVLLHQKFLLKLSDRLYITSLISALEEAYTNVGHACRFGLLVIGISSQVHSIEHCRFKNCLWSSRDVSAFELTHLQT